MSIKYFLYARKSSESEDRQMSSIDDQITEMTRLANERNIEIIDIISEARSAKSPGRKGFNEMVERIKKGEAQGILCWKLNRLARNTQDAGVIIQMLQDNVIQHIQTQGRGYNPAENVLLILVEFGVATQFSKDLRVDVRRGQRLKAERGWYPQTHLPAGYRHRPFRKAIDSEIETEPDTFEKLQRLWRLLLSGKYTISDIKREGDLRQLCNRKGKPYSLSNYYRIFTNEFYSGFFYWKNESGKPIRFKGKHQPMITPQEFQKAQYLLGQRNYPRKRIYTFPYRGLIACGECNGFVTAEHKLQVICRNCKHKYSIKTKTVCPQCKTDFATVGSPSVIDKTYYHCTKNKGSCSQGSISPKEIDQQILTELQNITFNKEFYHFALKALQHLSENNGEEKQMTKELKKRERELLNRIEGLIQMRADGEISAEELKPFKEKAEKDLVVVQNNLTDHPEATINWKEVAKQHLQFARDAVKTFQNGDDTVKKDIVSDLASNLTLKNKKLSISIAKPLSVIKNCRNTYKSQTDTFEPGYVSEKYSSYGHLNTPFLVLCRELKPLRTAVLEEIQRKKDKAKNKSP